MDGHRFCTICNGWAVGFRLGLAVQLNFILLMEVGREENFECAEVVLCEFY